MWEILAILIFILDIVAVLSVLLGTGSVLHKILWIAVIILFPVIGLIVYLLIGRTYRDA